MLEIRKLIILSKKISRKNSQNYTMYAATKRIKKFEYKRYMCLRRQPSGATFVPPADFQKII